MSLGLPGSLDLADVTKENCVVTTFTGRVQSSCFNSEPLVSVPTWIPAHGIISYTLSYLLGYWKVYGTGRFATSVLVALGLAYYADHYGRLLFAPGASKAAASG